MKTKRHCLKFFFSSFFVLFLASQSFALSHANAFQLDAGGRLEPGETLFSPDETLRLTMQGDNNLVLYRTLGTSDRFDDETVWASGTLMRNDEDWAKAYATLQRDGNFVIYREGDVLWATATDGNGVTRAILQNEGLFFYANDGTAKWSTRAQLGADQVLNSGERLLSPDGELSLTMNPDGNLVLHRENEILWASNTAGNPGAYVKMQNDGNLVIHRANNGGVFWSTETFGADWGADRLSLRNDEQFVLCAKRGWGVWSSKSTQIAIGEKLEPGQSKFSPDRSLKLTMQSDGNLVLFRASDNEALWASRTHGNPHAYTMMQHTDGNLVYVKADGTRLWSTETDGRGVVRASLQNDGNFVQYTRTGDAVWETETTGFIKTPRLNAGERLWPRDSLFSPDGRDSLFSPDGRLKLVMQANNNLVLYRISDNKPLWASGTWTNDPAQRNNAYARMQRDGNLVIYRVSNEESIWAAHTHDHPRSVAVLQNDDNFAIYAEDGSLLWQTNKKSLENVEIQAPSNELNIFTTDEAFAFTVNLRQEAQLGGAATGARVDWRITNYWGQPTRAESVSIPAGVHEHTVSVNPLPTGHYVLKVSMQGMGETVSENFAVVTPLNQRRPLRDSPFAIDTGGVAWQLGDLGLLSLTEDYARAVQLSGVTWIRDRAGWRSLEDEMGRRSGNLHNTFNAFASKGIKPIVTFGATPDKLVKSTETKDWFPDLYKRIYKLPEDLGNAYRFGQSVGAYYKDKVGMWEIWNEPEEYETGNGEGADKYAALFKAMTIGFRDSGASSLVSMGGMISHQGSALEYHENLFENGIAGYADIYNFHNHGPWAFAYADGPWDVFSLEKNDAHLKFKNRWPGTNALPGWVTEAGAAIHESADGLDDDYQKQKAQARYWVTSAAMNLSTGVDKHFWFTGLPLVEEGSTGGIKDRYWGSFSWRMTPYASYVAQSVMTDVLGEAKYRGEINHLPDTVKGHVFQDGDFTVLILWNGEKGEDSFQPVSLPLQNTGGTKIDIMGNKEEIPPGGFSNVSIGPDPVYLRIPGTIPSSLYTANAHDPIPPVSRPLTAAQKIVLDQTFEDKEGILDHVKNGRAYFLQPGKPETVEVTVYNFNDFEVAGTVTGSFDVHSHMAGYKVSGSQNTEGIPAKGEKKLSFTVTPPTGFSPSTAAQLYFDGFFSSSAGVVVGKTSPSVSRLDVPFSPDTSPDYEDSCNTLEHWSIRSGAWASVGGKLKIGSLGGEASMHYKDSVTGNRIKMGDGIVSAKVKLSDTKGQVAGLVVRQSERNGITESGYLIFIRGNRQLVINRSKGAAASQPLASVFIPESTTLNEVELMVKMTGNRFEVYVNGVRRFTAVDEENAYPLPGYVGPAVWDAEVTYDDFKFWMQ